jgi:hypothetical protein
MIERIITSIGADPARTEPRPTRSLALPSVWRPSS